MLDRTNISLLQWGRTREGAEGALWGPERIDVRDLLQWGRTREGAEGQRLGRSSGGHTEASVGPHP